MSDQVLTPSSNPSKERILVIDALRGFTLLGIVIVHMAEFYIGGPIPAEKMEIMEGSTVDNIVNGVEFILIRGKFFAIFSILFGLSFFIQMERGAEKEDSFHLRFFWRLVILFIIGYFHALFYRGDILTVYALLGIPLLLLQKIPNRYLWILVILLMVGVPRMSIWAFNKLNPPTELVEENQSEEAPIVEAEADSSTNQNQSPFAVNDEAELAYFNAIESGSLIDVFKANANHGFIGKMWVQFGPISRGYLTLGLFLIGLYLGRIRFFKKFWDYKKQILKWTWISFGAAILIGVAVGILFSQLQPRPDSFLSTLGQSFFDIINSVLLTIWVVGIFLLLYMRKGPREFFDKWMVPHGRMGLTNYVTQSIIGTFILFGWGLGMLGSFGSAIASLIAIGIFALQAIFSRWWLQNYKYGPLEWIWRSATYLKWQAFKK